MGHIESQLDRVRHERELWKEVVDKRAQQPLQLALTLKDPHTGQPLPQPGYNGMNPALTAGGGGFPGGPMFPSASTMMGAPPPMGVAEPPSGAMKASPLAKRIAQPK